jgi:hypothetical protein
MVEVPRDNNFEKLLEEACDKVQRLYDADEDIPLDCIVARSVASERLRNRYAKYIEEVKNHI